MKEMGAVEHLSADYIFHVVQELLSLGPWYERRHLQLKGSVYAEDGGNADQSLVTHMPSVK